MEIKPIKNETDYQQALKQIEALCDASLNPPEGEKWEMWTTLVEAYEQQYYPIEPPSLIEAIFYHLESRHPEVYVLIEGLKSRGVSEEIIQETLKDLVDISEV